MVHVFATMAFRLLHNNMNITQSKVSLAITLYIQYSLSRPVLPMLSIGNNDTARVIILKKIYITIYSFCEHDL